MSKPVQQNPRQETPLRDLTTYRGTRAVRHPECDYRGDELIHVTIRAFAGKPFADADVARSACENVEFYCAKLGYELFGYCLMPDHLHVLLSPKNSGHSLAVWLDRYKSYTTHLFMKRTRQAHLWQRSAHDHICRDGETAEVVLTYIVNNPVRAALVECWRDWAWTKVFIRI